MRKSLTGALDLLDIAALLKLAALVAPGCQAEQKPQLVEAISAALSCGEQLRSFFVQLDDLQRLAIGEAVHSRDNSFVPTCFYAKYGALPDMGAVNWPHSTQPAPLMRVFLPADYIPVEVKRILADFVPLPPEPTLSGVEEIPAEHQVVDADYVWQDRDSIIRLLMRESVYQIAVPPAHLAHATMVPITVRETAVAAQQDLRALLRLVEHGRLTPLKLEGGLWRPPQATLAAIASVCAGGDFYSDFEAIKTVGWPLLLAAAGLAHPDVTSGFLVLSPLGRQAGKQPGPELARQIWQSWLGTSFDEMQRLEALEGQPQAGAVNLSARRAVIVQALRQCPRDCWVSISELSRFIRACGCEQFLDLDPWSIYIRDRSRGSIGFAQAHAWQILEERYLLCFLFEFAATLGLIDIAYVHPERVRNDFRHVQEAYHLPYLSRYDGLLYVRVNVLGAYCLGLIDACELPLAPPRGSLSIFANMSITLVEELVTADVCLLLDTYAERESATSWRLARDKTLAAVENGHELSDLTEFLQAHDDQPLPETVEALLKSTARNARALKIRGTAILVECADEEIATLVAGHYLTRMLCRKIRSRELLVLSEDEGEFRRALNIMGYGMPR